MSDPRFARFKTDPRFRRPKKHQSKVVVDDRFKSIFEEGDKKGKKGKTAKRVDKYGRAVSDTHEKDNLRRFYRLEGEDEDEAVKPGPDYARGAVLLESSDEEEDQKEADDDSDAGDVVTLGGDKSKPIQVPELDSDAEIDLDEDNFEDLDAQAAAYSKNADEEDADEGSRTRRLAVVNLDWDHVRAIHLYKIFSSVLSPSASASASSMRGGRSRPTVRGKVISVRVYPSQFGKERMEREEREGPAIERFKKVEEEEDVNETNIYTTGDANEYDEDALRTYQLERLRYYYAIVTCDSTETASYLHSELQGTELERSANLFDLSFVPNDMTFDEEPRDEAIEAHLNDDYKGLDFVTDVLRHSKVKLTWDQDDPERDRITRRKMTKKEMEENDFRAYIASSTESESETEEVGGKPKKAMKRDQLRALLLAGGGDAMPEGWGRGDDEEGGDLDMEVMFMPALSGGKVDEETTLEKYQRKIKDKRKKRKEELKGKDKEPEEPAEAKDEFFRNSDSEGGTGEEKVAPKVRSKKGKNKQADEPSSRVPSTKEELELLVAADTAETEPKHFNMKAVLKAEKGKKKAKRGKKAKGDDGGENELQHDFAINVKDTRFQALHEDYNFAIDPSNPHFKKTKGMSALLDERSKRKRQTHDDHEMTDERQTPSATAGQSLADLVESVKRKSHAPEASIGKRRKLPSNGERSHHESRYAMRKRRLDT